jgi:hypothetical protein
MMTSSRGTKASLQDLLTGLKSMNLLTGRSKIYLIIFLIGVAAGSIQVAWMPGVPTNGFYHASDSGFLQRHLLGLPQRDDVSARTSDHPAWLALCGIYQNVSKTTGLSGMTLWNLVTPILLGINLCLFLRLTRNLGFDRVQGLGLTAVFLSTAATINWSVVLETHVLAPTSLMLAAIILSDRRIVYRLWNQPTPLVLSVYGVAIAIAASITITNAMLAILAVLPASFVRRPRPVLLAKRTFGRIPSLITAGLASVGILAFVHLTGWYLIQDPKMAQFLAVANERQYLSWMMGSWWESVLAVAWIAPPMDQYISFHEDSWFLLRRNFSTMPAFLSGLLVFTLTVCSIRFASNRAMFIPTFVVFGIMLHSIYGRSESFLFTANYAWATVISIGVLVRALAPHRLCQGAFVISGILLVANLVIWISGLDWIIDNNHLLPNP